MNCPTPYKQAFSNKGAARVVVKAMQQRAKRSKGKCLPQEPYKCRCGSVHLADPRRVQTYGKW